MISFTRIKKEIQRIRTSWEALKIRELWYEVRDELELKIFSLLQDEHAARIKLLNPGKIILIKNSKNLDHIAREGKIKKHFRNRCLIKLGDRCFYYAYKDLDVNSEEAMATAKQNVRSRAALSKRKP